MNLLAQRRRQLCLDAREWPMGLDITGDGLSIPKGFLRIFDNQAEEFELAGYVVKRTQIERDGVLVPVTLLDLEATYNKHYVWPREGGSNFAHKSQFKSRGAQAQYDPTTT